MQIYSKSMKNATSLSFLGRFWFCLVNLIGLGSGLRNFYTEVVKLINYAKFMQIYSKSMKNATSLSYLGRNWFCLFYLIGLECGLQNFYTEFWNSLITQIIQNQWKMLTSTISQRIVIMFVFYLIGLGAGFETFTQTCEIH